MAQKTDAERRFEGKLKLHLFDFNGALKEFESIQGDLNEDDRLLILEVYQEKLSWKERVLRNLHEKVDELGINDDDIFIDVSANAQMEIAGIDAAITFLTEPLLRLQLDGNLLPVQPEPEQEP